MSEPAKKGLVPVLLRYPLPTSPLSGGGALPQFPPQVRGGLGWACSGGQA